MISFEVNVTGPQIAETLARDPEEFWYGLKQLAEDNDNDVFHTEIAEFADAGFDAGAVVIFLRNLANAIEGGTVS